MSTSLDMLLHRGEHCKYYSSIVAGEVLLLLSVNRKCINQWVSQITIPHNTALFNNIFHLNNTNMCVHWYGDNLSGIYQVHSENL